MLVICVIPCNRQHLGSDNRPVAEFSVSAEKLITLE